MLSWIHHIPLMLLQERDENSLIRMIWLVVLERIEMNLALDAVGSYAEIVVLRIAKSTCKRKKIPVIRYINSILIYFFSPSHSNTTTCLDCYGSS